MATQFAQYFLTKAYQSDALSKISSVQYIGIVIAIILGYLLFDESYDLNSGMGIMIIIVAVILNVWYKNRAERLENIIK